MKSFANLIRKAETSPFYRLILNLLIGRLVPFNRPHHIKILALTPDEVTAGLPYRKTNLNHLKGIHACALANLCEFACGFQLMRSLGVKEYRLIMKEIKVDYHYQAKTMVTVRFSLGKQEIEDLIQHRLVKQDAVFVTFTTKAHDALFNLICTAHITWQIKPWSTVKTAVPG